MVTLEAMMIDVWLSVKEIFIQNLKSVMGKFVNTNF